MLYGYGRISSAGGSSLEDQQKQLIRAGVPRKNIILECYTGTTVERPKFSKLVNKLVPGDTLVVTKLDRFARTAADGAKLVQELVNRGITVNVLNMGVADNTPMGKLMVTIMLAFAEFERDMIVERTSSGKAIARQNPEYKEGRPRRAIPSEFEQYRQMHSEGKISITEACRRMGVSTAHWYRWVAQ